MTPQQSTTTPPALNPKVASYLRSHNLKDTLELLTEPPNKCQSWLDRFITQDKETIALKEQIVKLAPHNISVLLHGESGTGKELLANALHGGRKGKFVAVNVAGVPDTLLEAEFFGCRQGAFTGATNRDGYLVEANEGTLFLDEIGDMPLLLQCKLLRALQEGLFRPLGSREDKSFSCRIVAATNKDLLQCIKDKMFRLDFYYRIAGVELHITPLKERPDDICLIVQSLYPDLEIGYFDNLKYVEWPGNVRELIHYCERLKILGGKGTVL